MSLTLSIEDDASAALVQARDGLRRDLADAATTLAAAMLQVARDEASGGMLAVRTGSYLAGLSTTVTVDRDGVHASLLAKAPTAVILEYGATIPAHDISATAAKVMRFEGSAGDVFARSVHFPGAVVAPRPVLHTALAVLSDQIADVMGVAGERFAREAV